MNKTAIGILATLTMISCKQAGDNNADIIYPETKKGTQVDVYFGTEVGDPYRWLEDDSSAETKDWVTKQNEVTFDYLEKIPYRHLIKERMESLWNYERISAPYKKGDYTYYYKNNGLQNQSVLYRTDANGKEEVFLDPNTFTKEGTSSLTTVSFTKSGNLVAYAVSNAGSDWNKIYVMDTKTKQLVEEELVDIKFSGISWVNDEGFFYSSYDKPTGSELSAMTDQHKLYYHKLGTSQKDDVVFFGLEKKYRYVSGYTSDDGNYLFVSAANSTSGNELYVAELNGSQKPAFKTIVANSNSDTHVIDNQGTKLYMITNLNAPNKRLVKVDFNKLDLNNWVDIIPESDQVLGVTSGAGFLFASYMKDANSLVKQYDYAGALLRDIELPGIGTAGGFAGEKEDEELYFTFTNYTTPSTVYKLNPYNGSSEVYQSPKVDFNSDDYESTQVFYTSKDGTKIPMIITYKKGLKLDGKNPTMLYGYGGFNISLTPSFSVANLVWMENGGIYAVANLRGGGEYGKKWHDEGTQMKKQNVFDDFIAAAEFLIAQKYTSSDFLAIHGRSNGGLLVGATMTQRPDLMKVALPGVGVLDMLRYHTFTAGAGWNYDYGTAEDSKEMFEYLKAYSPVHSVKEGGSYPATMITTGDHDDRVVPAHSYKFAAELQSKQAGTSPVLIRIDVNAGHGAGKPISKVIEEFADMQAFSLYNMGIKKLK